MKYDISSSKIDQIKADCLVVAISEGNTLSSAGQLLDKACQGYLSDVIKRGDIQGKIGQDLLLYVPTLKTPRVLLVGCGKDSDRNESKTQKIFQHAMEALAKTRSKQVVNSLSELSINGRQQPWVIQQLVQACESKLYCFNEHKSKKNDNPITLSKMTFTQQSNARDSKLAKEAIKQGQAIASGMSLTKDLGNQPANICTPSYLAAQAKALAKSFSSIRCKIVEEAEMKKLGMNSLLSVAQGSQEKAKLIIMEYKGAKKASSKPIALVGKGITFDSGGISIKPAAKMDEMKYDMCGAASVFGTLRAIAELKLPINVIGVVASAENMPGGKATKPGDVYKSLSGQTIEIMNTDAEGRLVLCDALTYCERFKPDTVIDIATLTGAVIVALGTHPTGIMSNHQPLADQLIAAGQQSHDRLWQLPIWEDYQGDLDSTIADMTNLGSTRGGGSITAGCFLARFTKKYHWAHLDIAGTAWKSGGAKAATGRPVPMLTRYLINRCKG